MSNSPVSVTKRILVHVRERLCKCSVSVSVSSDNAPRVIHVRRCNPSHGKIVQKLERMAEAEVERK